MLIKRYPRRTMQLTPDGSEFAWQSGPDHTQSKIESRFKFWLAEWFADQRLGMPYFRDILGQKTPIPVMRSIFWEALTECPGVAQVEKLELTQDNRTRELTVVWGARLQDGSYVTGEPFIINAR